MIKIGIVFGGFSKEREISFAGGRTVYDNLNKSIFEAVPIFVDSFGNFVLLDWQYIYKGSIRDFYPPVEFLQESPNEFQLYAECLENTDKQKQLEIISKIGKHIPPHDLNTLIDFAFLCLHGPFGEDGKIQGLFDYLKIPYSGSGVLPSAIGIDKVVQKKLMKNAGFNSPDFTTIKRNDWFNNIYNTTNFKTVFEEIKNTIGSPMVLKSASQGSSIGISILKSATEQEFMNAVNKSFFAKELSASEWNSFSEIQKVEFVRTLSDIREGIGMPLSINLFDSRVEGIKHPEELLTFLNLNLKPNSDKKILLESLDAEDEVLIEGFIEGKEFSCIVVQNENNKAIALPPTEIKKGKELFDYRSKYLPGLARKITPIDLPIEQINTIRKECEHLFDALQFNVYARIDGFIQSDGKVFLNDPNTTSGMMPSSFFFHQAAEIGLNPSQFLTFIIRTSLSQRCQHSKNNNKYFALLNNLDNAIQAQKEEKSNKIKVAVFLGGYSSERHISVESGRNIYEKLASSTKYEATPVFLTGNDNEHLLYQIPINVLLKDNADDIKEKIEHYAIHPAVEQIISECKSITEKYSDANSLQKPKQLNYNDISNQFNAVFIALHGRPGEDGAVQEKLDALNVPYNGSDKISSAITINKFETNEILSKNGLLVAKHRVIKEDEWLNNQTEILSYIEKELHYPFIAKPVDDGCSSAVRKVKTKEELMAFAELIFRKSEELIAAPAEFLHIKPKEEFPRKREFLVEELISRKEATHFIEITGGMLTRKNAKGEIEYEVFEASEALSEGEVLSLEEKFLAGQGQNITPARYAKKDDDRQKISDYVKIQLGKAAKVLNVQGYCRIDAFVRVYNPDKVEVVFIEVNSLPGMTPATCIFHQTALQGYKPYDFIDNILQFAFSKKA
ncbi:MAG: D-alanine--D-alanine ligase [Bacteroidota bacterium]